MENLNTVIVIDHYSLQRKGIVGLLNSQEGLNVIGETDNSEEGLHIINKKKPDLVILDPFSNDSISLEMIEPAKRIKEQTLFLILTSCNIDKNIINALKHGINGYLLKSTSPDVILNKILNTTQREITIDDGINNILISSFRSEEQSNNKKENSLSDRENEILNLISEGLSNKNIASELRISEGTVKVHVKNLLRKLKVKSRLEAAIWRINHK